MRKQLASCFFFILALVLVAAVNTLTAQPESSVEWAIATDFVKRIEKMEGDIDFLARKVLELESTCVKKEGP